MFPFSVTHFAALAPSRACRHHPELETSIWPGVLGVLGVLVAAGEGSADLAPRLRASASTGHGPRLVTHGTEGRRASPCVPQRARGWHAELSLPPAAGRALWAVTQPGTLPPTRPRAGPPGGLCAGTGPGTGTVSASLLPGCCFPPPHLMGRVEESPLTALPPCWRLSCTL